MIWRLSGIFSLSLVLGLIIFAPITKILPLTLPDSVPVQAYELEGTVFSGKAGFIQSGSLNAKDFVWHLRPAHLLALKLVADISVSEQSRDTSEDNAWVSARVSQPMLGGTTKVFNLAGTVPLERLQQPLNIPFLPVTGQLHLALSELHIQGQLPVFAEGSIQLLQSQWQLGKAQPLGDYQAQISTQDKQIIVRAEDTQSGRVDIEATASIGQDRNYQLDARIKPKADTPVAVVNNMKALGRTDSNGWYSLQHQGTF
jgi:general secretion pathway protein N